MGKGGTAHALGTASVVASEPKTAPPAAVTFLVTGLKFSRTVHSQMFHLISSDIQYLEPENTNELTFPNFCRHTFVCTCPGACFHQAHYLRFLRNACSSNCSEAISHGPEFHNLATLVSCLGRESMEQSPRVPKTDYQLRRLLLSTSRRSSWIHITLLITCVQLRFLWILVMQTIMNCSLYGWVETWNLVLSWHLVSRLVLCCNVSTCC